MEDDLFTFSTSTAHNERFFAHLYSEFDIFGKRATVFRFTNK